MEEGRRLLEDARVDDAIARFRSVLFLDGEEILGRFWYAAALHRAGRDAKAAAEIAEVERRAAELPDDACLSDGVTTVGQIRSAATLMKASLR